MHLSNCRTRADFKAYIDVVAPIINGHYLTDFRRELLRVLDYSDRSIHHPDIRKRVPRRPTTTGLRRDDSIQMLQELIEAVEKHIPCKMDTCRTADDFRQLIDEIAPLWDNSFTTTLRSCLLGALREAEAGRAPTAGSVLQESFNQECLAVLCEKLIEHVLPLATRPKVQEPVTLTSIYKVSKIRPESDLQEERIQGQTENFYTLESGKKLSKDSTSFWFFEDFQQALRFRADKVREALEEARFGLTVREQLAMETARDTTMTEAEWRERRLQRAASGQY